MTVTHYAVLQLLAQHPGLSNSQLARGAFVSRQSMNVLLQFLERAGIVTRPAEAPVGKMLPTRLTPLGRRQLAKATVSTIRYSDGMTQTAASTIRGARVRAGLTQTELAAKANISQSVVSAYESAKREPSFETLRKLVAAAGFDLDLIVVPAAPKTLRRQAIDQNRMRLQRTLRTLGARNIRLFGSVARGDDGPDSDIDLLVDVAPDVGLFALGRMRSEAERILGTTVDLVPANSLKPDLAERVLAEAIAL